MPCPKTKPRSRSALLQHIQLPNKGPHRETLKGTSERVADSDSRVGRAGRRAVRPAACDTRCARTVAATAACKDLEPATGLVDRTDCALPRRPASAGVDGLHFPAGHTRR